MPFSLRHAPLRETEAAAAATGAPDIGILPEWNLADLYPAMDSPQYQADLAKAAADSQAFSDKYRGKLAEIAVGPDGGERLAEAVKDYEALDDLIGRIMSYAGLIHAGDTSDPKRAKFFGDTQDKMTTASSRLLFFTLEFNKLDDGVLETAMLASATLDHYRPWIEDIRREKPYQLEDRIEELFFEKATTSSAAFNRLFDETMAALRFTVDGETMSLEVVLSQMLDPRPERRKAAAEGLAATLKENERLFTLITNTLAKDKEIADRWRGFKDVADSRHLANRVEPEVVDAMVEAVREAYPRLSHRYYALKAKWFGMEQLNHWDRNAPLPRAPSRLIGWDEAKDTVLSAYAGFDPAMADIAQRFFDRNWIDAPVRAGKAPGAFAHPTVPSAHPYVLLNYQGRPRDVMTLAHELGHGVHQVLAAPQGALMAPTPLTLAETASVFGEMLTFRALLARTTDPVERQALLASKVEDMINTVVRQIAFYVFERRVHALRREGELTAEQLGEVWREVQAESLGPAVKLGPGYETYWSYIPHFIHVPFYVYAYAFGDCLVNSLYAVYQEAESGFQQKYFAMLKAGGTKHHKDLLAPFGLDASDPAFWHKGLAVIDGLIGELEAMEPAA
ncbi:MAG: M3 family oligoendopeptidase [Bauldia sp.]|nr:M3 family oligoendopeptidase [Bauldia sp.]